MVDRVSISRSAMYDNFLTGSWPISSHHFMETITWHGRTKPSTSVERKRRLGRCETWESRGNARKCQHSWKWATDAQLLLSCIASTLKLPSKELHVGSWSSHLQHEAELCCAEIRRQGVVSCGGIAGHWYASAPTPGHTCRVLGLYVNSVDQAWSSQAFPIKASRRFQLWLEPEDVSPCGSRWRRHLDFSSRPRRLLLVSFDRGATSSWSRGSPRPVERLVDLPVSPAWSLLSTMRRLEAWSDGLWAEEACSPIHRARSGATRLHSGPDAVLERKRAGANGGGVTSASPSPKTGPSVAIDGLGSRTAEDLGGLHQHEADDLERRSADAERCGRAFVVVVQVSPLQKSTWGVSGYFWEVPPDELYVTHRFPVR